MYVCVGGGGEACDSYQSESNPKSTSVARTKALVSMEVQQGANYNGTTWSVQKGLCALNLLAKMTHIF